MKIAVLVEGATEEMFREHLRAFLKQQLGNSLPKLDFKPQGKALPKQEKMQKVVANLCESYDAVIALSDVYGTDFISAEDAKQTMRQWAANTDKFYAHVALHDFEAWLLPYWSVIQELTGTSRKPPSAQPEIVNNDKPPSFYVKEAFEIGQKSGRCRSYKKTIDSGRILRGRDLTIAANACPELKSFLNTILRLCGGEEIA